jgi:hypothetical protein
MHQGIYGDRCCKTLEPSQDLVTITKGSGTLSIPQDHVNITKGSGTLSIPQDLVNIPKGSVHGT